jgi:branched-chain amino acid transport system permease protein
MTLFTSLVLNGLTLGAIYALVAMSFSIIFTVTRTFHFAHGAIYTWVAYVIATLEASRIGFAGAVVVGLVVSICLSVGVEILVYRPLRRKGATGLSIFVASLGMLIILDNIEPVVFGSGDLAMNLPGLPQSLTIGSITLAWAGVCQFIAAVVILVLLAGMFRYTALGRSFRAVASNPQMATLMGIDARRKYIQAFVIGAVILCVAAILAAASSGVSSDMGDNIILITLIAVVVGGVTSIEGAALGGWLIGLSQSISAEFVSSDWQTTVAFVVCMVFILFRPTGILGRALLASGV